MKKIYFLLILFSVTIHGQTKIDKFVSVDIPGKVEKLDTIIKNVRIVNFISQSENETFMVQKTILDSTSNDLNSLPSDLVSLKKTYRGGIDGFFKSMKAANIVFEDSSQIKIDKYLGYKVSGKSGEKKKVESIFLVLNEHIYLISYFNLVNFNENTKDHFLKSIKIDSSLKPSQTLGNTPSYKQGYIIGKIICFLLLGGLIFFIAKKLKK